jgi:parallel beta-helix repeat protein
VKNSLVADNVVFGATDTGILVQGTGGNNMLNGNLVMKSSNGIIVGSDTVLDDNEVVESTNDGISVVSNNMVRDNQIFGSGGYDLVIGGSGNNFSGNRFKTCNTSGQPCP